MKEFFTVTMHPPGVEFCYLKGPRSPRDVRRLGYALTNEAAEAWPFETQGKAARKAAAVARHFSWPAARVGVAPVRV